MLLGAARVRAAAAGRSYVVPEDVKALAVPAVAHRLVVTPDAELRASTARTRSRRRSRTSRPRRRRPVSDGRGGAGC
ncbi:hypothetical protein BJF79_43980 [Actinomadura sp. CNU-125]|nr:hypothetical protein BJF79_43980 [Actinomadura sp. CNU-125]